MYTQIQGKMKWTVLGRMIIRQKREREKEKEKEREKEREAARDGSKAKIIKP